MAHLGRGGRVPVNASGTSGGDVEVDRHLAGPTFSAIGIVYWLCSNTTHGPGLRFMRPLSISACSVLQALVDGARYGFDVIDRTGLPSGTVYPALSRLERDGYVTSAWESARTPMPKAGRRRRYYRVTAPGVRALGAATRHYQSCCPRWPDRRADVPDSCAPLAETIVHLAAWLVPATCEPTGSASGRPNWPAAGDVAGPNGDSRRAARGVGPRRLAAGRSLEVGCDLARHQVRGPFPAEAAGTSR